MFLLYVNDVAVNTVSPCRLFPSDNAPQHSSYNVLDIKYNFNRDLNIFEQWSEKWFLRSNSSKTKLVLFTRENNYVLPKPISQTKDCIVLILVLWSAGLNKLVVYSKVCANKNLIDPFFSIFFARLWIQNFYEETGWETLQIERFYIEIKLYFRLVLLKISLNMFKEKFRKLWELVFNQSWCIYNNVKKRKHSRYLTQNGGID